MSYQEFLTVLSSKPAETRRTYEYAFGKFQKAIGLEPDALLILETADIQQRIKGYLQALQKKGHSFSTQNKSLSAIQFFFKVNDPNRDPPINWSYLHLFLTHPPPKQKVEDRAYTEDELNRIYDKADLRTRCALRLMAEAGLRIGALPELRLKDLELIAIPRKDKAPYRIYAVRVYAESPEAYTTFTASASDMIRYAGKRLGDPHHAEAPLFLRHVVGRKAPKEDDRTLLERLGEEDDRRAEPPKPRKKKEVKPISKAALTNDVWKTAIAAGVRDKGRKQDRQDAQLNHGMRKRFRSTLQLSGLTEDNIEWLMGHSSPLARIYSKLPAVKLLHSTGYARAILRLRIAKPQKPTLPTTPA